MSAREGAEQVMKMVPHRGKAKVVKWPTRLGKLMAVAGEKVNLRQQGEGTERGRWIEELKTLFREVGLPAAEVEEWEGAEMAREWAKVDAHRHSGSTSRRGREPGHGWLLRVTSLAAARLSIGNVLGRESAGARLSSWSMLARYPERGSSRMKGR